MIGCIRLVNPDRRMVLTAIAGRMVAYSCSPGGPWSLRLSADREEFWPGRDFVHEEIEAWAEGCPLSAPEQTLRGIVPGEADERIVGAPAATNEHPMTWA